MDQHKDIYSRASKAEELILSTNLSRLLAPHLDDDCISIIKKFAGPNYAEYYKFLKTCGEIKSAGSTMMKYHEFKEFISVADIDHIYNYRHSHYIYIHTTDGERIKASYSVGINTHCASIDEAELDNHICFATGVYERDGYGAGIYIFFRVENRVIAWKCGSYAARVQLSILENRDSNIAIRDTFSEFTLLSK